MKTTILLLSITLLLAGTASAIESSSFLVRCRSNVPRDSAEFQQKYPAAFNWLIRQHREGLVKDIYFPLDERTGLTYIVESTTGERKEVEKLIASDPLVEEDHETVGCEIEPLGVRLPIDQTSAH